MFGPDVLDAEPFRFFTGHQAAVVEAATARIAPGPLDDPAEAGHPGAREADARHLPGQAALSTAIFGAFARLVRAKVHSAHV